MARITDDEMVEMDRRWREMPGTPPDGWSFIPRVELQERGPAAMREIWEAWREAAMTHARMTDVADNEYGDGVWIEVWRERPEKEADFNPPMTLTPNPRTPP